jgi:hypothetical protein
MRRPSAPFLAVVGVLIGILLMALIAPDHATDAPGPPANAPVTTPDVGRSAVQP